MKTSNAIARELIARRNEYDRMMAAKRAKTKRTLAVSGGAAAACLLGFALLNGVQKSRGEEQSVDNITPNPIITPEPTVFVQPTAAPMASLEPTSAPIETPLIDPTAIPDRNLYVSEHTAYFETAHTLISGGAAAQGFHADRGGVFFGFSGDALIAYQTAMYSSNPSNLNYSFADPIETFPRELGERARRSVADNIRKYKQPDFSDDENLQLYGFMGKGYIIFTDEPFHGYQASAIFALNDGGEWMEFKGNESCSQQITGGCILPGGIGILCYLDREGMRFDDYSPRKLLVYRTQNYGETWEKIETAIPEEYEGIAAPPSCALTPVFECTHGVMMASFVSFNRDAESALNAVENTVWFESFDSGASWVFMGKLGESAQT